MSEQNQEISINEKVLNKQGVKTRDEKGHLLPGFNPQKEAEVKAGKVPQGTPQPDTTDYIEMNSVLAIQLGISDRLAELQTQYKPQDLFKQLSFMRKVGVKTEQQGLPPNQQIAGTSSQATDRNKTIKIPHFTQRGKLNLKEEEGYEFHGDISMIDLIKNKKRK